MNRIRIIVLVTGIVAAAIAVVAQTPPKPDVQMQAVLDQLARLGPQPSEKLSPQEARKQPPPATVITAQIDPLRSEGEVYAKKLQDAGVKVHYQNFDGVTHEFFGMSAVVDKAKLAVQLAGTQLKSAFNQPRQTRD